MRVDLRRFLTEEASDKIIRSARPQWRDEASGSILPCLSNPEHHGLAIKEPRIRN
jgi:hypothetical protein